MIFTMGLYYAIFGGVCIAIVELSTKNQMFRNIVWGIAILGALTIGSM